MIQELVLFRESSDFAEVTGLPVRGDHEDGAGAGQYPKIVPSRCVDVVSSRSGGGGPIIVGTGRVRERARLGDRAAGVK